MHVALAMFWEEAGGAKPCVLLCNFYNMRYNPRFTPHHCVGFFFLVVTPVLLLLLLLPPPCSTHTTYTWRCKGSDGTLGPGLSPLSPRHLAWQAWHLAIWTFSLRGRCGTSGTGKALMVRLVPQGELVMNQQIFFILAMVISFEHPSGNSSKSSIFCYGVEIRFWSCNFQRFVQALKYKVVLGRALCKLLL